MSKKKRVAERKQLMHYPECPSYKDPFTVCTCNRLAKE
jgi:hypothetical protein